MIFVRPYMCGENNPAKRPEVRAKISLAKKGLKWSLESRKRFSEKTKGRPVSEIARIKIGLAHRGKPKNEEWNRKNSEAQKGERNHNWQGGKTPEKNKIRNSREYAIWRKAVFERDDYTCQDCGKKGAKLNADHIKPFAIFPEFRLSIDNGRTLCEPCHKKTDTYAGKTRKIK